jgi:hypothetical protein
LNREIFLALKDMIGGQYQVRGVNDAAGRLPLSSIYEHKRGTDAFNGISHLVRKRS